MGFTFLTKMFYIFKERFILTFYCIMENPRRKKNSRLGGIHSYVIILKYLCTTMQG